MRGMFLSSVALVCLAVTCVQAAAQDTPPAQADLQLYTDANRSSKSVFYNGWEPFDVYAFCRPEVHGLAAAEFKLVLPTNVAMTGYTLNPDISVCLGEPINGISVAFTGCQTDWVWLFYASCIVKNTSMSEIATGPHTETGLRQYATCEPGYPLKEFQPGYCPEKCITVNYHNSYEPIHITSLTIESPISLLPEFDGCIDLGLYEPLWRNFKLRNAANHADSIRCIYAIEHPNPWALVLERPMTAGTTYVLEAWIVACCGCWWGTVTDTFLYTGGFEPRPDLSVAPFYFDQSRPSSCVPLPMPFHVSNNGAAACDSFTVALNYIASYNPRVESRIMAKRVGGIAPGDTLHGVFNIEPDAMDHHTFFVLRADPDNEIAEWTETNNWTEDVMVHNHNPIITSIADVPGDHGGSVKLTFYRSDYEQIKWQYPNAYHVLRRIANSDDWEDVALVPGTGVNTYSIAVPTATDSSGATADYWSTYEVELATILDESTTEYHTSCPDSGYSVDNSGGIATLLQGFSAGARGGAVVLEWTLSAVDEGIEFLVFRSTDAEAFAELDRSKLKSTGLAYEYVDDGVLPGRTYTYRIEYETRDRRAVLFTTREIDTPAARLALHQNRPNPFNPSTTISFYLPVESAVTLDIYDVGGRLVTRLLNREKQAAGSHDIVWDGRDSAGRAAASGIYVYRLVGGKEILSRKMVLLK